MRLTNVALITLPAGRVFSYGFEEQTADADAPVLPISFDQGRHVREGDRPGSWMAIAFRVPESTSRDELAAAWRAVIARHGTLQTVFSMRSDALELHRIALEHGTWQEHAVSEGSSSRQVVRSVFDTFCRPFARPSHRMVVVEPDATASDRRSAVLIGSDHAHVDMWSFQVLVRDLAECLDDLAAGRELGAALPEAPTFAEHTALLERMPPAPTAVAEQWTAVLAVEGGTMPVFPMPLGDLSAPRPEVVEVRDLLDADGLARFEQRAAEAGVRLIAWAMSCLTDVTAHLASSPLRAVFPVHSRHDAGWHDSVGWFITNAVIESADPTPSACAAAVKQALLLGSQPLAPLFAPYGGMPQGPGMFALSWLDSRRLPIQLSPALDVQHVSAVITTDGVMVWFIVNDGGVHLRVRYPDTPEARQSLTTWMQAVTDAFENAAT